MIDTENTKFNFHCNKIQQNRYKTETDGERRIINLGGDKEIFLFHHQSRGQHHQLAALVQGEDSDGGSEEDQLHCHNTEHGREHIVEDGGNMSKDRLKEIQVEIYRHLE